jgi:hypothetical protein
MSLCFCHIDFFADRLIIFVLAQKEEEVLYTRLCAEAARRGCIWMERLFQLRLLFQPEVLLVLLLFLPNSFQPAALLAKQKDGPRLGTAGFEGPI